MRKNPTTDPSAIAELGKFLSTDTKKALDAFAPLTRVVGTSILKLDPLPKVCPQKKTKKSRKRK